MQSAFFARLRRSRGPAVTLAAGLLMLQAFVAGLAIAQAAVELTPEAGAGWAVICHGNGTPSSDTGSTPDPSKAWHACCVACAASAGPATLPLPWGVPAVDRQPAIAVLPWHTALLMVATRAVRAGLSQAPPRLD
ncbi:MAG TPA: DUF2946 family protein [Xanthobacteraceae bacterium]|nr:DUF2946 family protein [Xanthobacteraceae bacterium]